MERNNLGTSLKGNGCGSVGRAVNLNVRDTQFKFSHWQFLFTVSKTKISKKEVDEMANIL